MSRIHQNKSLKASHETRPVVGKAIRVILYDLCLPGVHTNQVAKKMEESHQLVQTYGGEVVKSVIQKRHHPSTWGYVGYHKMQELIRNAYELNAHLIIINDALKPKQIHHLETCLDDAKQEYRQEYPRNEKLNVWDRVDLIIKIFSQHAHTAEARLQLDLARLEHFGPRIYGMGEDLSQQGGGIGTRGLGETNTEIMKRHIAARKKILRRKLDTLSQTRSAHRTRRYKNGIKTIAIIGYTNTGKSALFSRLTSKKAYSQNKLFATLQTLSARLSPPKAFFQQNILPPDKRSTFAKLIIADTIGFIEDLPPKLLDAFRSTIEDILEADMLLHVIDISDDDFKKKISIVEAMLHQLGAKDIPQIMVFNKLDILSKKDFLSTPGVSSSLSDNHSTFVSAKTGENIEPLKETLFRRLTPHSLKPY